VTGEISICNQNCAGLAVVGPTFRNETMLFSVIKIQKGKTCYSEEQVISMLEFLIDNIFISFGGTRERS
jgi:hypothetical protein